MPTHLDPRSVEAYYDRGLAFARKGEFVKVFADHIEAIQLDPMLATSYPNRGSSDQKGRRICEGRCLL